MEIDYSSQIIELPPSLVPKRDADRANQGRATIPVDVPERPMPAIPALPSVEGSPPPPVALSLPPPLPEPPSLNPLSAAEGRTPIADDHGIASEGQKSAKGPVLSKKAQAQPAQPPRHTPVGALVFLGLFFGTVISVFIFVAATSGEKAIPVPVASQPPEATPAPATSSTMEIYVDTTTPSPSFHSIGDRPTVVSATPYPAAPNPTNYAYVRPTVPPATPALKIARTYVWRNSKYAIPQDSLSDFNAIKNAGVARLKAVEKIDKQLAALPAQIAKSSRQEKTRLLQLQSDLQMDGSANMQEYEGIAHRMDMFIGDLVNEHPECVLRDP